MPIRFRLIATPFGHVGIVASSRGLRRVFLSQASASSLRAGIRGQFPDAVEDDTLLSALADDLRRYFVGEPVEFAVPLDCAGASVFQGAAWGACREVGYGQTATYKQLAEKVGRPGATRAIGLAMGRNPCPIVVPCHRVLASDGSLGGYSGPGGVEFKQRLLGMEANTRDGCRVSLGRVRPAAR